MNNYNSFDIQIEYVHFNTAGPEWSKTKFPYPHHRLYYITGGEATLILNDSKLMLRPGYIYLIPAFSMVETICKSHLTHHYCHFFLYHREVIDLFSLYTPATALPATEATLDLFTSLSEHYQVDTPYAKMITHSVFYKLLAPFFQACQHPEESLLRFEPVLNYIDNNLETQMTNKQLAKIMSLDSVYFTNLFSKALGLPPTQYIIKKRLEVAQRLLLSTDYKIKDIAIKAGFENHMYFSRIFKKKLKITPLSYRMTYRN